MRSLLFLTFAALACAAVAEVHRGAVTSADRTTFAATCDYYGNRAGPGPGTPASDFAAFLSEVCAGAETALVSGTPEQRARSALLLARIAELRRTVAGMNAARAAGGADDYDPVSPSGEFLIAHRLGVFRVFEVWLDTGVPFSVASYP